MLWFSIVIGIVSLVGFVWTLRETEGLAMLTVISAMGILFSLVGLSEAFNTKTASYDFPANEYIIYREMFASYPNGRPVFPYGLHDLFRIYDYEANACLNIDDCYTCLKEHNVTLLNTQDKDLKSFLNKYNVFKFTLFSKFNVLNLLSETSIYSKEVFLDKSKFVILLPYNITLVNNIFWLISMLLNLSLLATLILSNFKFLLKLRFVIF